MQTANATHDAYYNRARLWHLFWSLEVRTRRLPHKRKRRDRFPNLAASHAPSTSVRRTCRGARLATTLERAASDQWTARSPLATTILGARPLHAHGPFASDPSTGFPSSLPSREGVRCLVKDDLRGTPEAHRQLSPPRETLRSLYSARCSRFRVTPSFVRQTICLAASTFKRENQAPTVDWRDNED